MPCGPHSCVWMSLLGAGTVYSDVEMRETHCKKRVLELDCGLHGLCYDLDFRAIFCNRKESGCGATVQVHLN
jgi:hypothetical protein